MFSGICKLCHGFKNLFCVQNGVFRWLTCPGCNGQGTCNTITGPATIRSHAR